MYEVLVLVEEEATGALLGRMIREPWVVTEIRDWPMAFRRITVDPDPPAAFICGGGALTQRGFRLLRLLHERGYLVPTAAFFSTLDAELIERASDLTRWGVKVLIHTHGHPSGLLDFLSEVDPSIALIVRHAAPQTEFGRAFLRYLAEGLHHATSTAELVASGLGVSRTTLYDRLSESGLPSVSECQAIFRLLPALRVLVRGGTAEDAAFSAQFSDAATMRRAIVGHLGLSISEVRSIGAIEPLVVRWADLHVDPAPGDVRTARTRASGLLRS